MGTDVIDVLTQSFIDEIIFRKRVRNKAFDSVVVFDQKSKIYDVCSKIYKLSKELDLNPFYLFDLFLRYTFPFTSRHTSFNVLNYKWTVFKNDVLDNKILDMGQFVKTPDDLNNLHKMLSQFEINWNRLASKYMELYANNASSFGISKICLSDLDPYVRSLKINFYTRPECLAVRIGDIMLDKASLELFIKMVANSWYIKSSNSSTIYLGHLVKNDFESTKYFVRTCLKNYKDSFKRDLTLSRDIDKSVYNNSDNVDKVAKDNLNRLKDLL